MPPNTCSRDGFRLQGSARRPNASPEIIDLTEGVSSQQTQTNNSDRNHFRQFRRNSSLIFSHRAKSVYKFGDVDLKLGNCVELREPSGDFKIQFVEIKSIWTSRTDGSVTIRGLPYARNHGLDGMLENKRNEVCQILEIDADDERPDEAQALFEITPDQILQVRTLYKTNAAYPEFCYGNDRTWYRKTEQEREEQAPLTCRWKFWLQYQDHRLRKACKPNGWALLAIAQAEASERFRCSAKEIRLKYRGKTHRGGSYKPEASGEARQYVFADMFCGGGGTSHGAAMAGFKVSFGVDHWATSCETWRRNFPDARMFEQNITDFILHNPEIDWRTHPVDILHLSPPCQWWSLLANIHPGHGNEQNMTVLFACSELINKHRPRVFTLEQTDGILQAQHRAFFNALIKGFTNHGYSIRWKRIPLVKYGLPQNRHRLVMIGACPGEELPPWPRATHDATPGEGQKPLVTEAQAIRGLDQRRDPLHDVANALVRNSAPRDANKPFGGTITCGGAQGADHFSGGRTLTVRELACIQGFPRSHLFVGNKTEIKKQIGNAFPSCVVKAIYEDLRKWLERADGVQARPPVVRVPPRPLTNVRRRRMPAPAVPTWARDNVNGDLNEHEALELALQESRRVGPASVSSGLIEISDDEDQQDSPVSAVAPLLERMSIAPSDTQPDQRAESGPRDRSRSVTLDFSPSPTPGPSRRAAAAASQKRSLDSMNDGEADETMKEESPPKRERVLGEAGHQEGGVVDDSRIPSRLSRYVGPESAHQADDEDIVIGQPRRGSNDSTRNSHGDGSPMGERASHQGGVIDDVAPGESIIGRPSTLSPASAAGTSGDDVWTFD